MASVDDNNDDQDGFKEALRLVGPAVVEVQSPRREEVEALKNSPQFLKICQELDQMTAGEKRHRTSERFLLWAVPVCLNPPLEELLTASERRQIARSIKRNADGLRLALTKLRHPDGTPAYPLQPYLSRLSVFQTATDYLRWKDSEAGDHEEIVHRIRFAIYHLLAYDFDNILDSLSDAADALEDLESQIHRPRNQNAKRLYFLRAMTLRLNREYGGPCRKITLSLASLFFDCDDLDEAAVSKLAPVPD